MFEISDDPVVLRSRLFSFLTYILSRGHCLELNLLLGGDHPEAPVTHHGSLLHPSILGYLTFRETFLIHFANAYFTFIDTQKRKVILLFFYWLFSFFKKYLYVSMYEFHIYVHVCTWRAEDGIGSPESGVTVGHAPPCVCWEPIWVLLSSNKPSSHRAVSPFHWLFLFLREKITGKLGV